VYTVIKIKERDVKIDGDRAINKYRDRNIQSEIDILTYADRKRAEIHKGKQGEDERQK